MQITKGNFISILQDPTPEAIDEIDRALCRCGYIHHWYYKMMAGTWNPMLSEMDYELKDVKTTEQLYEFLIHKQDAI